MVSVEMPHEDQYEAGLMPVSARQKTTKDSGISAKEFAGQGAEF
jgi:hypothetical protein